MAALEFIVDNTALDVVTGLEIKTNYEEFKTGLTEFCKPYANMVVTADDIANAKGDRAKLRKIEKSINDYRIKVKSVYSEPIKAFEEKCKELTAICKGASDNIDAQVKKFEEEVKEIKLGEIRAYFENHENKYPSIITFDKISNPKWGNTTHQIEQCYKDVDSSIETCEEEIETIISMQFPDEKSVLVQYATDLDFKAAVKYGNELKKFHETFEPKEVTKNTCNGYQITITLTEPDFKTVTEALDGLGIKYHVKEF